MAPRESSLFVTKVIYSGFQEHRIIAYTATGQKQYRQKEHMSTENTDTGHSNKHQQRNMRKVSTHVSPTPLGHLNSVSPKLCAGSEQTDPFMPSSQGRSVG
jgi:hypothetical protein